MNVIRTELPGVLIIEPRVHNDERGFFLETFQAQHYQAAGIHLPFVQDNHSRSRHGVIRGLHYQLKYPQGKLVSVSRGAIYDVVLDIRQQSVSYGQWIAVELNDTNHRRLYVPPGYAHGICVCSEVVDLHYKCTDYYVPGDEYGVRWDDPALGIPWPVKTPILSQKDKQLPILAEAVVA